MQHFATNNIDCRRVQILGYFDEKFSKDECKGTCDTCKVDASYVTRDVTDLAKEAAALVKYLSTGNVTILYCVDVLRGSKSTKVCGKNESQCPLWI